MSFKQVRSVSNLYESNLQILVAVLEVKEQERKKRERQRECGEERETRGAREKDQRK